LLRIRQDGNAEKAGPRGFTNKPGAAYLA